MKKVLVITDNGWIYKSIKEIIDIEFNYLSHLFEFRKSPSKKKGIYSNGIEELEEIDVNKKTDFIIDNYEKVISLHCKQIFPQKLISNIKCINVHPGYNPHNRGWYPQVFAILNKKIFGATIHIMDEEIDNGAIIDREEVRIFDWETSKEAYEKVLDVELKLFRKNIHNIINNTFEIFSPEFKGDYCSINDYKKICQLDLNEKLTMKEAIDRLRSLSHGDYNNAFFYDDENNKIYVKIKLDKENE